MNHDTKKFDFNGLFIFELANNHQGSIEHGKNIIQTLSNLAKEAGVKAAIKFQFRDLDTFIHPDYKNSTEYKHIPRFLSTRLSKEDFAELLEFSKSQGLQTMSTPFDERSVELIGELDVEIIKIASCSANDWPLLTKISGEGKPVVCSTAGLRLEQIDNVVSFFKHKGVDFALLHCVSIYPTPDYKLNLQRIETLKKRYPGIPIGFSTHEDPAHTEPIMLAYAKGARIFEKHVGMATNEITLNDYSATPEQVEQWLESYNRVKSMLGSETHLETPYDAKEDASLKSLMRGVYLKNAVKKGELIQHSNIFFAMPLLPDQMPSGSWNEAEWRTAGATHNSKNQGVIADKDYQANDPLQEEAIPKNSLKKEIIYRAVHEIKAQLHCNGITYNHDAKALLFHPIGIKHFFENGACFITCIQDGITKKLVILLPGQTLINHYHTKKRKKIQILAGSAEIELHTEKKSMFTGEVNSIPNGEWHSIHTQHGTIFEELSKDEQDDEIKYKAKEVLNIQPSDMRTPLKNWGRHQFDDDITLA